MNHTLTIADLIAPGGPLFPAEVIAGQDNLRNPVSWVVSLRPYPPALPRLQGGELALVATEHLARLEPPTTLADLIRQLASRDAAAVAVRGEIDKQAVDAATQTALPLLQTEARAALQDIEQAVMRECALYQARREILPVKDPQGWADDLLAGRLTSAADLQSLARKEGFSTTTHYAVAYLIPMPGAANPNEAETPKSIFQRITERIQKESRKTGAAAIARPHKEGLAVILPPGTECVLLPTLDGSGLACGIGREKPFAQTPTSLSEATLAASASSLLYNGTPTRYTHMGADTLLILLYSQHHNDLENFVEAVLGPILRHDARSTTPFLPTLRAFMEHGGRLRETAAAIYVHRNTLAYRLDRAAEILGVDLKDPSATLSIQMALRALPLTDAPTLPEP
ncbi:MAG: PucR family transcriptional regulator [Chloroflexi bacterium]|nr:PucR family transcriptional regulator [Chloroflexota bacterium]